MYFQRLNSPVFFLLLLYQWIGQYLKAEALVVFCDLTVDCRASLLRHEESILLMNHVTHNIPETKKNRQVINSLIKIFQPV